MPVVVSEGRWSVDVYLLLVTCFRSSKDKGKRGASASRVVVRRAWFATVLACLHALVRAKARENTAILAPMGESPQKLRERGPLPALPSMGLDDIERLCAVIRQPNFHPQTQGLDGPAEAASPPGRALPPPVSSD